MHLTQQLGAVLFLALVPLSTAQDDKKADTTKPRKPPTPSQLAAQELRADLLGAWRLVRATTGGEDFSGANCGGVLLVMPDYLSINARFDSKLTPTRRSTGALFACGSYRWSYDEDRLLLVSTTMVGVDNFTRDDEWAYEPSGVRREYQIDLADDALTLTRDGGRRFEWTRMSQPSRDEEPTKK